MSRLPLLALAVLAWPLSAAAMPILPVSQDRRVAAGGTHFLNGDFFDLEGLPEFVSEGQEAVAPGFGPFDAAVEATIPRAQADPLATAQQTSSIGDGFVAAAGTAFAEGFGDSSEAFNDASGSGLSQFVLVFDLAAATDYVLDITLDATAVRPGFGLDEGVATLGLVLDGGGTILSLHCVDDTGLPPDVFDCGPRQLDGTLAAGRYTLTVEARATSPDGFDGGAASYDLALALPEPGAFALGLLGIAALRVRRGRG